MFVSCVFVIFLLLTVSVCATLRWIKLYIIFSVVSTSWIAIVSMQQGYSRIQTTLGLLLSNSWWASWIFYCKFTAVRMPVKKIDNRSTFDAVVRKKVNAFLFCASVYMSDTGKTLHAIDQLPAVTLSASANDSVLWGRYRPCHNALMLWACPYLSIMPFNSVMPGPIYAAFLNFKF